MAIFTMAATWLAGTALFTGTFFATTFGIQVLALGIGLAASIGLSYVAKSLSGNQPAGKETMGTQGTIAAGGAVPRAFGIGYHVTAGSLVYANYWGSNAAGTTPNAYLTQVIAVSDLPREQLLEVWVSGEKVTLLPAEAMIYGAPVQEYFHGDPGVDEGETRPPEHHLWIKYFDGTQVAADVFLTDYVSTADRPYGGDRIGTGICYVVCTSLVSSELFSGFPTFKFALSGIPLYDPSRDDTAGGVGSHRWSTPSTWGGDGDQLPAVQIYNLLRGIRFNGNWIYGLQNMGGARLPAENWIEQIEKCRVEIDGDGGPEPTYRSGGQINVDAQPANAIEACLTACQGKLSEIGGFYKLHCGAPDAPAFAWTDADLLSNDGQSYRPFFSLADSVNGIQGTYPDPAQGWETATAPPLFRTDLEAHDGGRRLMAAPQFAFVPYPAQVQRLQKSGLEEAQRARTHTLPFPPAYWQVEPGDVGAWTSTRNGYASKLFRVDSVTDRANLDLMLNVTEIDPADYDWDHELDFVPVVTGPTGIFRPPPQGVVDFTATGTVLYDADGIGRHAAIRITWDGTLQGIVGVQYEVRLAADHSEVCRGRTDQFYAGALIISQGLLPLTTYEVRIQYIPSAPRAMLWSDWLTATTLDIVATDLPAWITNQVTAVLDAINDRVVEVEQRFATLASKLAAQDWDEIRSVRSQLVARSDAAFAEIATVETVAVDANEAVAALETSVTAQFETTNANVTTNANAIATFDGYAATQYTVTLDSNGYASGFELLNGGTDFSSTTFITDSFRIVKPGTTGGAAVVPFAIDLVGAVPKIALRADMIIDGAITATKIATDAVTANKILANTITASKIAAGTITSDSGVIGNLSVKTLSIAGKAVTVPESQAVSVTIDTTFKNMAAFTVSIDTAGITGQGFSLWAIGTLLTDALATNVGINAQLNMNNVAVQSVGGTGIKGGLMAMSYKIDLVATGGTMVIPVALLAALTSGGISCTGSLFAMATKR